MRRLVIATHSPRLRDLVLLTNFKPPVAVTGITGAQWSLDFSLVAARSCGCRGG